LYDLSGRVAVVTGASGFGIGATTAELFVRHGADVVICSRNAETLNATAKRIEEDTGGHCVAVPTNVKHEDEVVNLMERATEAFGRIDILVNSAGGNRLMPLSVMPTKAWDAAYDLNVKAAYLCTREAGRHFLTQRSGVIVNISSGASLTGILGGAHYSAAKSALNMFTTVSAAEWGRFGIRINSIAVGLIVSKMSDEGQKAAGIDSAAIAETIPLRRVGRPIDVANVIHFLVSDAAAYVTGQTFAVNGGPILGGIPENFITQADAVL
jgi:NAD(P)-dependent dehydrogenase (short-subunit alcohol dehydrogenase family)